MLKRRVGSPFYMAPEMLLERDYSEKVDVYSFGIMLWELFTLQEPYKDRFTDLDELIEAVTAGGERPQWPSGNIENVNATGGVEALERKVKDLVEWCWSGNDSDRPGFTVICDKLWDIVLEFTIWSDEVGRKFWKDTFYDKWEMTWEEFWRGFEKTYGVKSAGADNERRMKCMKLVMTTIGGSGEKNNVTMSDWGLFLAYFGKIKNGNDVLDNCERVAKKPWFFGSLSMKEVESFLLGKKKGTFLVRFSASNAGSYTVSVIDKKNKVKHIRIGRGEGGKYGFEGNWCSSLEEFINVTSKSKENPLEVPCSGSPYQNFFVAPPSATYSENEYLAPGALQRHLK
eukprot:TRINITY_DN1140_c0_g1_i2.p1 TRINITY_DN1140_c0_g1~~TRINITY_DN1140_c0_g1_i2.p1  ORF type:complete len:342 (-),score=76.17 TRINITY_DN1140_c0_g1_i2:174-1199(-)